MSTASSAAAQASLGAGPWIELGAGVADAACLAHLPSRLRLGTRRSKLARTQSRWVADRLSAACALMGREVEVELVDITTEGDVSARANTPVIGSGTTGIFVSALRDALLEGRIDLAVHSLKDLPTGPAEGLVIAAVPVREDSRDVLVARDRLSLAELPAGARIGTGSLRRAAQLRALGIDFDVVGVRGNVDTRIRFVTEGELDAVVLARAGLVRLNRADEATDLFDPFVMLPAPGQGALAVECRDSGPDDVLLQLALGLLDDPAARVAVAAERALLAELEAGCSAPVGALAEISGGADGPFGLTLRGAVVSVDGTVSFRRAATVPLTGSYLAAEPGAARPNLAGVVSADDVATALELGRQLADDLLAEGAAELIPGVGPVVAGAFAAPSAGGLPSHPAGPGLEPATPTDLHTTTAAKAREGDS